MLPCAYKSLFGIDCPACGIQRSFWSLLKGDPASSFAFYPPLIPVLILILFSVAWLIRLKFVTTSLIKNYSIFTLIVVIINYTFKLIF